MNTPNPPLLTANNQGTVGLHLAFGARFGPVGSQMLTARVLEVSIGDAPAHIAKAIGVPRLPNYPIAVFFMN